MITKLKNKMIYFDAKGTALEKPVSRIKITLDAEGVDRVDFSKLDFKTCEPKDAETVEPKAK
jgi:hypothetical protein